jgi:hypothetical protein
MVASRQNSVPLVPIGLWHGRSRSRSRRERDHHAIDDNAIGTGSAGGFAHLGERALALPTWRRHWRGLDQLVIIIAGLGRRPTAIVGAVVPPKAKPK